MAKSVERLRPLTPLGESAFGFHVTDMLSQRGTIVKFSTHDMISQTLSDIMPESEIMIITISLPLSDQDVTSQPA